mgnify:CR=1 FL=1
MGKEDNILRKVGTKNPFQVPDHYFEEVVQEVMARLPEKAPVQPLQEVSTWQRIKPWVYMAAMFCGIMLSVRIFVGNPQQEEFPISQAEAEMLPDDEWEIMVRRTLIDDYEFYEYLTENK